MRAVFVAILLGLALSLVANRLRAQTTIRLSEQACESISTFVERAAEIRDLGARRDAHIALVKRYAEEQGIDPRIAAALVRELRVVYAERGKSPGRIAGEAKARCMVGYGENS